MTTRSRTTRLTLATAFAAAAGLAALTADGQAVSQAPDKLADDQASGALEGVSVTERLGEKLPLDLQFVDETGKTVRLGDYFQGDKPVVVNLGYYECPMLCGLVLNGLTEAVGNMDWNPGEQFQVVTLSVDPGEGPQLAKAKKNATMAMLSAEKVRGWHFLTGDEDAIRQLADAAGWHYRYLPERDEYAHPAAILIASPDGMISRYMAGVRYDTSTLKYSLIDASEGKVGSLLDRLVLSCFHYNPERGEYTWAAMGLVRLAGGATLLVLVVSIGGALMIERLRRGRERKLAAVAP